MRKKIVFVLLFMAFVLELGAQNTVSSPYSKYGIGDNSSFTNTINASMGGIYNAKDAIEFFLAGATAVAVGTATFTDPSVISKVHDGLVEYCERKGFEKISDLTGALDI